MHQANPQGGHILTVSLNFIQATQRGALSPGFPCPRGRFSIHLLLECAERSLLMSSSAWIPSSSLLTLSKLLGSVIACKAFGQHYQALLQPLSYCNSPASPTPTPTPPPALSLQIYLSQQSLWVSSMMIKLMGRACVDTSVCSLAACLSPW